MLGEGAGVLEEVGGELEPGREINFVKVFL